MKVTLAYPWTDEAGKAHKPDTTVDVPDATGAQLLREGRARTPDTKTAKEA